MQGVKVVVFGVVDYVFYGNIQQGELLKVIFLVSGMVIVLCLMMIFKISQYFGDVKVFIDYVLLLEGQVKVVDVWLMFVCCDVVVKCLLLDVLKVLFIISEGSSEWGVVFVCFSQLYVQ